MTAASAVSDALFRERLFAARKADRAGLNPSKWSEHHPANLRKASGLELAAVQLGGQATMAGNPNKTISNLPGYNTKNRGSRVTWGFCDKRGAQERSDYGRSAANR
jgi:hypothetical protein